MLGNEDLVTYLAQAQKEHGFQMVCDPVFTSTTGASLLAPEALTVFKKELLPKVFCLTPNIPEAEALCGFKISNLQSQKDACEKIHAMGASHVLIKGGHATGDPTDVFYDGDTVTEFSAPRQSVTHTRGTGCVLSAAITAGLILDHSPKKAVSEAHTFLQKALAAGYVCTTGAGPVDPLFALEGPHH